MSPFPPKRRTKGGRVRDRMLLPRVPTPHPQRDGGLPRVLCPGCELWGRVAPLMVVIEGVGKALGQQAQPPGSGSGIVEAEKPSAGRTNARCWL